MLEYSAKNLVAGFGPVRVQSLADGDAVVKVAFDGDGITSKTGVQGETSVSKSAVRSGTITIKMLGGCAEDLALAQLQKTEIGLPAYVMNANTGESYVCAKAYLKKQPDAEFGATPGDKEWVIVCPELERAI